MKLTIRGRIGLSSFAVFVVLLLLESGLVLGGLDQALREVADQGLLEKLEDMSSETLDASLPELVALADDPQTDLTDLVFEIRDFLEEETGRAASGSVLSYSIRRDSGHVIAGSSNLRERSLPTGGYVTRRLGVAFRDEVDPGSTEARHLLRVAEIRLGPYRVELARSLRTFTTLYRATRARLLAILFGVSLVAALGSYLVAARALFPVRHLVDEARRLRALSVGSLPRTGRCDEIDDLAAVLNELLARVRADVMRTRQFTADAAHEIRTPLAAIRGHLELLLRRVDESAQETLSDVLEEVDRLSRLVNQLLLLEKLQERPQPDELSKVDLASLAEDLIEHLGILASDQGIELSADLEPGFVRGDPEKLRQLFLNVIDNALKHTPQGGVVRVRVRRKDEWVTVSVADSGPGIPSTELEQIFERFSSDRSRRTAGTGLGLPIARAIARAHGGELTATSPAGAEFILSIPASS